MPECIFCKIANKKIPSDIIFEDEKIIIFKDLSPVTPIHLLVIPKNHINSLSNLNENGAEIVGYIFKKISELEELLGIKNGYRVITNCKEDGGQTVPHLHFHILSGKKLPWPGA